jgi:hypothetical protein
VFNTRAELKNRAKSRADADGSDFPSDTSWNFYLDEAAREVLGDLVLAGWPMDYDTATVITNSATRVYALGATNVLATTMVYTISGGQVSELKRVNPGHVPLLRSTGANGGISRFYEVRSSLTLGPVIELFPPVGGTYFVDYIQDWPGFVTDGGNPVWNGPARSDELITLRAAEKAVRKEGRSSDGDRLTVEYDKLLVKVKDLAGRFDMRNPAQMRDEASTLTTNAWNGDMFAGPGGMF